MFVVTSFFLIRFLWLFCLFLLAEESGLVELRAASALLCLNGLLACKSLTPSSHGLIKGNFILRSRGKS